MLSSLTVLSLAALSAAQNVYNAKSDGLSQHTIYMPSTSGKIPVLVWSSGGCMRDGKSWWDRYLCSGLISFTGGSQHGPALKETAAHGVMIIAMGTTGGGMGGKFGGLVRRQLGGGMGSVGSNVALQEEAFAWLQKNAGEGKYANVDISRVAVAGQSCGGLES
jgi:hypothetical protein